MIGCAGVLRNGFVLSSRHYACVAGILSV
jgi:hypothetical protein